MSPAVLRVILAGLALSTLTALGTAQAAEVSGTVQRVDTVTRTVYFSDGRVVTLEPGAPKGATNLSTTRTFRVLLLPAGTTKDVTYEGRKVTIRL